MVAKQERKLVKHEIRLDKAAHDPYYVGKIDRRISSMREEELVNLVRKVQSRKTEFQNVELKATAGGFPT